MHWNCDSKSAWARKSRHGRKFQACLESIDFCHVMSVLCVRPVIVVGLVYPVDGVIVCLAQVLIGKPSWPIKSNNV